MRYFGTVSSRGHSDIASVVNYPDLPGNGHHSRRVFIPAAQEKERRIGRRGKRTVSYGAVLSFIIFMKKNPCYNCSKRTAECHATCNDYISWRKGFNEEKQVIWENRLEDKIVGSFKKTSVDRARRRRGK